MWWNATKSAIKSPLVSYSAWEQMKKKHRLSWKSLLSYISSVSCHGIASWLYCQSFLNAPILVQLSRRRQNYMIMLHFTHSKVYVDDTASKIRITQRIPSVMNNLDIHEDQYNFHNFSLSDSCVKCSFWKLAFNRLAILRDYCTTWPGATCTWPFISVTWHTFTFSGLLTSP